MRALIDYHHADLVESLHLLLEDRLGIELFVPVGRGWWDQGYWQFGRWAWGDDRLANQFLTSENVEVDDAHPERHHRCIEVTEALDLDWDYVVASVPDNYGGYHAFAQQTGAKFVIQVGNANQPIAWNMDPLVLNSSEAPLLGKGVNYHQEFSLAIFHPSPVTHPHTVASFVNCMDRLPCWPLLVEAQALLADWEWRIHGIDGADGNLKPDTAIADAMRAAGWAWHDKVTGDGFGHVLHNWAAIGRPLIGHASHYRGQLGASLWQDGVTCIDLDRHGISEAVALMRDGDPQAMGNNMRVRFAELVDYAAEAERVRELLS